MQQEDFNSMMKTPAESLALRRRPEPCYIYCPECGMEYLGDGVTHCLECQKLQADSANGGQP
jgi:hypothetical protein